MSCGQLILSFIDQSPMFSQPPKFFIFLVKVISGVVFFLFHFLFLFFFLVGGR